MIVTVFVLANAVWVVNDKVKSFEVAPGTRSAGATVKLTPVTWPPMAGYPQVPAWSVLVLTLMPLDEAEMGPPMVAPVRVMVRGPAANAAVTAICTPW